MGRSAEGWKLVKPPGRKFYSVKFRHAGVRYHRGCGTGDPGAAAAEAARIYSDVVSGREAPVPIDADLEELVAKFLVHYGASHAKGTTDEVETHFAAHAIPFFRSLSRMTAAGFSDFIAHRLTRVSRSTLRKELSSLRQFREWLLPRGVMLPEVPRPPKGAQGTRAPNARKAKATILRPAEVKKILAAMPLRSRRTGAWVRPLFAFLWESGLRPSTVLRLQAGVHYKKGAATLKITEDIDKEGFARTVPLSKGARKALDQVFPASATGPVFDAAEDSLRFSLEAALKVAGMGDREISPYDFKHSRISLDANGGLALAGIAHMVGHKRVSTTSLYITTGEDAARAVLRGRRA